MINFVKYRLWFFALSLAVIIPGIVGLSLWRLNLGLDFTGGSLLELSLTDTKPQAQKVKDDLARVGFSEVIIQKTQEGNFLLRLKPIGQGEVQTIKEELSKTYGKVEEQRFETVGPVISQELTTRALQALFLAILGIIAYITWAFREVPKPASSIRFGVTAVLALIHDVLVLLGAFAILGKFFGAEIDLLFVTAALTVIGFSVHDTIVVFDRIRENLRKNPHGNFSEIVNISLTQTLGRSLATSLTVVFVLFALLLFGGTTIRWFVVALLIGIISGTYSSIFNASQLLYVWQSWISNRKK